MLVWLNSLRNLNKILIILILMLVAMVIVIVMGWIGDIRFKILGMKRYMRMRIRLIVWKLS